MIATNKPNTCSALFAPPPALNTTVTNYVGHIMTTAYMLYSYSLGLSVERDNASSSESESSSKEPRSHSCSQNSLSSILTPSESGHWKIDCAADCDAASLYVSYLPSPSWKKTIPSKEASHVDKKLLLTYYVSVE
ncbi:hypothetical protein J1614_001421 [Plenodomus biglobosus]|nr:hypothetical protein J1614_001421 [Plenodomus biglobosus]